jgi:hypothetical protein
MARELQIFESNSVATFTNPSERMTAAINRETPPHAPGTAFRRRDVRLLTDWIYVVKDSSSNSWIFLSRRS